MEFESFADLCKRRFEFYLSLRAASWAHEDKAYYFRMAEAVLDLYLDWQELDEFENCPLFSASQ
ncbi:MAG: hypothetical protein ACRDRL_15265 [Sciscionella sp.]